MAQYKLLYIDDENDETTAAIADGLKIHDLIDIEFEEPKDFKTQKQIIEQRLNNYDGIILDLRLDGKKLDISYNAPALAQEIRLMAAEGVIKSCPIILCSTDDKMRATYEVDRTSHDLFDYKFTKEESPPWAKFAKKIASLAKGYQDLLSSAYSFEKILSRSDLQTLDHRIFEKFLNNEKNFPASEYAGFIIKDLFHQPGPLIKERLLAARLGVDIAKSGQAWVDLLTGLFKPAKYQGVFSDGWDRWWADTAISIFKEASKKRPSMLKASDRVKILIELTGLSNLVAADPMPRAISTNFWTVCEAYKTPLDPLEGFKIHTTIEPKSWQEDRYISLEAVLNKKGPKPHSSEANRIKLIKESLASK
ncbi:MAG: hypothetical protein JWO44_1871 [Bacteroidetes bacterium]|nr:hypothetical protein [Bacteroidota bacterium]